EFFKENNLYAMEEIARRLLEAKERGLWKANEDKINRIREVYGEIDCILEDTIVGEVQGGAVEFLSSDDVEYWKENMKEVDKAFRVIK
ncbi:MAG: cobaltochelatase subunit CobN, partial [Archaeoglobaceae archaeon]|nr:cobaltochelatase subunit CobN [Archaeoglobaceae archaeon]MDW8118408.1 cobaltochelatase subunit CobN [Archaeoglobaceae archaeon]